MKIYLLNFDETPKEVIEGKTSTCNINLDGNSAIRRTCSIGITGVKDMEIHKTWWGINSKIKVEIGIINELDDTYPEVIWLPLGTYLIDSFSYSENITNVSINITGKDKIAQLNGMSGGYFGQTVVLDKIEIEDEEGIIST
jgi:hypothetical protein